MTTYALSDSFSLSGEWYLPADAGQAIAGELQYSQKGIELRLHNTFRPLTGTISAGDSVPEYPVVHGITTSGESITILKAIRSAHSLGIGAAGLRQAETLISSWLLIGRHVDVGTTYPEVRFRIPGLQVWLSRAMVQQKFGENAERGESFHSFQLLPLQDETVRVDSLGAAIAFAPSYTTSADPFSIAVKSEAWVVIRPDTPQTLEWYLEQQGRLEPLLAFLAGTPMSPDRIEARLGVQPGAVAVQVSLRDVHYCTFKGFHEFFMPRGTMDLDLSILVNNWFELNQRVRTPSQLALSVLGSEGLWLHVEFLSLIQALEGFHRGLYPGTYMSDEAYERVKRSIGGAIPNDIGADHRASLASRIRYGNQISLAKRLNQLVECLPESVREVVLGIDGKIPRSWIDTRNYHTHWDEELRANVIEGQEMYNANVRMRSLLRVLYLHHVGVPEAALRRALTNTSNVSQQLVHVNATDARRRNPSVATAPIVTIEAAPQVNDSHVETTPLCAPPDVPASDLVATDQKAAIDDQVDNDNNATADEPVASKVALGEGAIKGVPGPREHPSAQ
ncbi:HEPN domain-containing protein [Burkholderia gladioli]|uniref:ApeA N-terminal domain 1-containing protein n=1 Tax=Burkholderia gladioli TaxID=28095 RepID=UPI0016420C28|nr:HEPN domain-containing protein [Burkholderia gladioli]